MSERPENLLPMSEEMASFLQQIKADPDNDDSRLIFADWLEEQNDPRGPLIRLQCEIVTLPEGGSRWHQLQKDVWRRILSLQSWFDPMPQWVAHEIWQRGLPKMQAFLRTETTQRLEQFSQTEWWHWCETLRVRFTADEMDAFVASPVLSDLTSLDLGINNIGDSGVEALSKCTALSNLTSLALWSNNLGDAAAEALAKSPVLSKLTWLDLRHNHFGNDGVQLLRERFGDAVKF